MQLQNYVLFGIILILTGFFLAAYLLNLFKEKHPAALFAYANPEAHAKSIQYDSLQTQLMYQDRNIKQMEKNYETQADLFQEVKELANRRIEVERKEFETRIKYAQLQQNSTPQPLPQNMSFQLDEGVKEGLEGGNLPVIDGVNENNNPYQGIGEEQKKEIQGMIRARIYFGNEKEESELLAKYEFALSSFSIIARDKLSRNELENVPYEDLIGEDYETGEVGYWSNLMNLLFTRCQNANCKKIIITKHKTKRSCNDTCKANASQQRRK